MAVVNVLVYIVYGSRRGAFGLKLEGVKALNNFQFESNGIRVRKGYQIHIKMLKLWF